jgi:hypothetical protein
MIESDVVIAISHSTAATAPAGKYNAPRPFNNLHPYPTNHLWLASPSHPPSLLHHSPNRSLDAELPECARHPNMQIQENERRAAGKVLH